MVVGSFNRAAALVVAATVALVVAADGKTHVVGDIFGWTKLGPHTNFYNLWADFYEFHVNDTLLFKFKSGEHTVAEVTKEAYDTCNVDTVMKLHREGPEVNVTLTSPGTRFFICTVPGHCVEDERFAVNVS